MSLQQILRPARSGNSITSSCRAPDPRVPNLAGLRTGRGPLLGQKIEQPHQEHNGYRLVCLPEEGPGDHREDRQGEDHDVHSQDFTLKGQQNPPPGVLPGQVLPVGDQDADRHGPEPDRQVHHRREEIRVDEAVASDPASLRDSLPLSPRPLCLRGEEFFEVCRNRGTPCSSRGEAATGQLRDLTLRPAGLIGISRGVLPWVCAHRPPLARGIIPTAPLLA